MAQIILDSNNNLIQGDFDNATVNNRTKFKTTTTNATTNVYAVPNGSATSAGYSVANNADPTNCSKIVMATNGSTDTQIISGINGTGSYLPMSFYTNNALAMQITTAGNIVVASTAAPAFSAYNNATQTHSGGWVKVILNTEEWDTNNNFDSTTNYRFTPTVAGYYQVNGQVQCDAASMTRMATAIYKNGALYKTGMSIYTTAIAVGEPVSAVVYFNGSTDYVELYVYIAYSAGTGSIGGSSSATYFQASMIRSA